MYRKAIWLSATLLVAGCDQTTQLAEPAAGPSTPSLAATIQHTTTRNPITFPTENPCLPGDVVLFTGEVVTVSTVGQDAAGGFHRIEVINAMASGTGSITGVRYRFSDVIQRSFYVRKARVTTSTRTVRVAAQGPVPDFVITAVFHLTLNANGELTAVAGVNRTECRG